MDKDSKNLQDAIVAMGGNTLETKIAKVKKVANDIFLQEKLNLAVIGPFEEKKKNKLEKLLKI